jgi:hypothetical protein
VDVASGKQKLERELMQDDPAGIFYSPSVQMTPDSKYYAYSYKRVLSELYVVDGLK